MTWGKTPTYNSWDNMKRRCKSSDPSCYPYYRGRGITYCEEWEKFNNFLRDMGERPEGRTLDRKNNDKGYDVVNCRWATKTEQLTNRRAYSNTGEKFISKDYPKKGSNWFRFVVQVRGKKRQTTKTLEEAIKLRDELIGEEDGNN